MRKSLILIGLTASFLAACGNSEGASTNTDTNEEKKTEEVAKEEAAPTEQTITYLGQSYTLPAEVKNIIAASLESMEDAAILGVKPLGAVTTAGELPAYLAADLEGATSIGEKTEPNYETILSLKPDVILGSSKYKEEVANQLNKIRTMIPVSHISTNWEDNLRLMGTLSGKTAEADKIIADYKADAEKAKATIAASLQDKEVFVIRVRQGSMFVYPADVYLNPVIYNDLGLKVPELIGKTAAQEEISLETLADVNPDIIFLQFEKSENSDNPAALDDILKNPIFQSIDAAKNNQIFVNAVDPMAQGGTAWSKVNFLQAAVENLSK
ncbi:iron-hydroxamate ABC transporter substrate-binding protein [Cytobacillus praedii]|uniref:iron-hydroxamate ABC transporter substrate-binding protein n=1 Tax=Cytobacillus praedii TaxID=1742358 RepID=UPI00070FE079|nr:iron-hydroxamate ABC transporter substrate-binding protein [Cytobacillus praedii]